MAANMRLRLARLFLPRGARLQPTLSGDGLKSDGLDTKDMEDVLSRVDRYRKFIGESPDSRRELYSLYEELDEWPEISGVLDAYAEETTQEDHDSTRILWVESDDEGIAALTNECILRLGLEEASYPTIRDIAKLGEVTGKLYGQPQVGLTGIEWTHPRCIERVEAESGMLIGFLYDPRGTVTSWTDFKKEDIYKPWDFVHMRLRGSNYSPMQQHSEYETRDIYGTSILKNTRVPQKQLKTALDMLMVYRLSNTLDRRNIMIDVGESSSQLEQFEKLQRWKGAMKRTIYKNPETGEYDVLYHPLGLTEDLLWPTWTGSQSRIDITPGQPNIYAAYDVDTFYDRVFGSMRAKKSWFGYGEETDDSTRAFSARSMQFGRQAMRVQKAFIKGVTRILQIHLALLGRDTSEKTFTVKMVPSSPLAVLQRLEITQTTVDAVQRALELGVAMGLNVSEWSKYLLSSYFGFSDQEIERFTEDGVPMPAGGGGALGGPVSSPGGPGGLSGPPGAIPGEEIEGEEIPPEEEAPPPPDLASRRPAGGKRIEEDASEVFRSFLTGKPSLYVDPGSQRGIVEWFNSRVAPIVHGAQEPLPLRSVREAYGRLVEDIEDDG